MGKIHVNPNTGEPGRCDAQIQCRFGNNTPHFENEVDARKHFEKQNAHQTLTSFAKGKRAKFFAVGGALAATFSLAACSQSVSAADVDPRTQQTTDIQVKHPDGTVTGGIQESSPSAAQPSQSSSKGGLNDLKEAATKAKDKLKNGADSVADELNKKLESAGSGSAAQDNSAVSTGGVLFQGRPLSRSAAEVAQAKAMLAKLKVNSVNEDVDYDRSRDYGRSFETGVVGRLEHRDAPNAVFKNPAPQSRAIGGTMVDPYTGEKISISTQDQHDTNVDHIIPLKRASMLGGSYWNSDANAAVRKEFANDPLNTAVVGASANQSKSDSGPSEWMVPSYAPSRCAYAIQQIKVVDKYQKYGLGISAADKATLANVLATRCN